LVIIEHVSDIDQRDRLAPPQEHGAAVPSGKKRKLSPSPGVRENEMTRSTDATGLLLAVLIAEDLAAAGRAADGYAALLDGLRRVRKEVQEEDPLVRQWRWSVDEFAARWSIGRA
jgi:hypothetical protein